MEDNVFYELANDFRNFNRCWDKFDRHETNIHPESIDKFIEKLKSKYKLEFLNNGTQDKS